MRFQMMRVDTPIAKSVQYAHGVITIEVEGGKVMEGANLTVCFNPRVMRFLAHGTDEELAQVRILQEGYLLHWYTLNTEVPVPKLLERLTGLTDPSQMGRMGGLVGGTATTEAKAVAARRNGAKGGRPPKNPNVNCDYKLDPSGIEPYSLDALNIEDTP